MPSIASFEQRQLGTTAYLLGQAVLLLGLYALWSTGMIRAVKDQATCEDYVLLLTSASVMGLLSSLGLGLAWQLVSRTAPRLADPFLILMCSLLVVTIVIDLKVFSLLGVHLYDPQTLQNLTNDNVHHATQLSTRTVVAVVLFVPVVVALESAGLWCSRRWARVAISACRDRTRAAIFCCLACLAVSLIVAQYLLRPAHRHGNPILETLPLYSQFSNAIAAQERLAVAYPPAEFPTVHMSRKPDIVVILAESLRADMLTSDLTPTLHGFAQEQATLRSNFHTAGTHTTEFGVFSLLYGLHAHHYSPFMHERMASVPLAILADNGYELASGVSAKLSEWNYAEFMFDRFDVHREFGTGVAEEDDAAVVNWASHFLEQRKGQRPLFLFLFLNSTHHNYVYPREFERFTPVLNPDENFFLETTRLAESRHLVVNRYRNSLGYVDHLFGRIHSMLREHLDEEQLVVVFSGDHGEEFWEHGLFGHSATRFVNERVCVPLLLRIPGSPRRSVELSSHADILPTVLSTAGLHPQLRPEYYSNGRDLTTTSPDQVLMCGAGFPYHNRNLCLVTRQRKYWLRKNGSGLGDFDVILTTDLDDNVASTPPDDRRDTRIRCLTQELRRFLSNGDGHGKWGAQESPPSDGEDNWTGSEAVVQPAVLRR
jgi:membrane-anchored protein YejM (alkaline phosphatase superfamily)